MLGLWSAPCPQGHLRAFVLVSQLQNITSHPHLLTVHDFEQEGSEELDTVILKALVKGESPRWRWGGQPLLPVALALCLARGCFPHPVPSWLSPCRGWRVGQATAQVGCRQPGCLGRCPSAVCVCVCA